VRAWREAGKQSMRQWRLLLTAPAGAEGVRSAVEGRGDGETGQIELVESRRAGEAAMRNEALQRVEAEYVMFMGAGDRLAPSALSHLISATDAGAHGASCGSWFIEDEGGTADGPALDPPEGTIGMTTLEALLGIPPSAALVRASLLEGMRFGANLEAWSHTDLWLRLCEEGVRWQVTPAAVTTVPHDREGGRVEDLRVDELRSVIERSFRRASAKGWEDERLDEAHEREAVRSALFTLVTRAALTGTQTDATRAAETFGKVAQERCLTPTLLSEATAIGLRYSPQHPARVDGQAERAWAKPVHEWWSRCVTQKWIARHELEDAVHALAELLVDPRVVARELLSSFGSPSRLWVGGTDRAARAVIEEALEAGWRVLVLPGRAARGVNQRLMALPPRVIGSADEATLLERYSARPNVARWNGAWRTAYERTVRRLESAWPKREI